MGLISLPNAGVVYVDANLIIGLSRAPYLAMTAPL